MNSPYFVRFPRFPLVLNSCLNMAVSHGTRSSFRHRLTIQSFHCQWEKTGSPWTAIVMSYWTACLQRVPSPTRVQICSKQVELLHETSQSVAYCTLLIYLEDFKRFVLEGLVLKRKIKKACHLRPCAYIFVKYG